MILNKFCTPLYIKHSENLELNNHLNNLCYDIEKNDQAFDKASYPNGYTSFFTKNNLQSFPDSYNLCLYIIKNFKEYSHLLGYDIEQYKAGITSLWVSRQSVGANHQLHNHRCSFISGTYYSQSSVESAQIRFQNPAEICKMNWPEPDFASDINEEDISVPTKSGLLILFPSYINHEVLEHADVKDRIAWSFNINLLR